MNEIKLISLACYQQIRAYYKAHPQTRFSRRDKYAYSLQELVGLITAVCAYEHA